MIDLIIVDDHAMFREGLARCLAGQPNLRVVGQFSQVREALSALKQSGATMVLLDAYLGSERAVDVVKVAKRNGFGGRILIVTAGVSAREAIDLVQAGVSGILHKHHSTDFLCDTIRRIAAGNAWIEEQYLEPLFRCLDRSRSQNGSALEDRERQMLRGILEGLSNRDIAQRDDMTEAAVKSALHQLFRKLGVGSRAQLVKVALEQYRDQL